MPNDAAASLRGRILEVLTRSQGRKVTELAEILGVERREISRCLSYELAGKVQQGSDYRWRLVSEAQPPRPEKDAAKSEIARLCQYYLECIGQDMDEGVSTFARNDYGNPGYALLSSAPLFTRTEWWIEPGVGKVLGKVRADRTKLVAWFGYPVRLRHHQTAKWEGFFAEPVLMWPVVLADANGDAPGIDEHIPTLNLKFLRSMAMGDAIQISGEAARLSEELGLGVPADELPDLQELVERLVRLRPDWDWREEMDPSACLLEPELGKLTEAGIYNRAIIVPGQRSPYTQGLETELKSLSEVRVQQLSNTSLGSWLSGDAALGATPSDDELLIEVLPMNTEQRAAVKAALNGKHAIVTGPPGTGKSQVVTNILVNAAWRGMKVLFASKNNKAVDVVESRVNGLGNRPVLLRLGAKDYQVRLAEYLTQLLAGNPQQDERNSYEEGLRRHKDLAQRLAALDQVLQKTLSVRNEVDQLEAQAEDARPLFGARFFGLDSPVIERAEKDLNALAPAVDQLERDKQGWLTRLFWHWQKTARLAALDNAVLAAAPSLASLGTTWHKWQETDGVASLQARLDQLRQRVAAARKVVAYRQALRTLQQSTSFEEIARQRAALTEQVSQNSQRLWRDWVQLAPTRLTPEQRRDVSEFAAVLQLMTGPEADRVHPSVRRKAKELQAKVTAMFSCWAVTSLSARGRVPLEPGYFDLVIIDEASQCDIASALPLLYRAKRSVIIGDPMQLRHISKLTKARDSELQHRYGLVQNRLGWMYSVCSLFDVAGSVVNTDSIINLRDHHRSHADIIRFSNETFYEGRLRVATRYPQLNRPNHQQPGVVWQHVAGKVVRPRTGGAENASEAQAVTEAIVDLLVNRGYRGTIGVVTPFRAQAMLLEELIYNRPELDRLRDKVELLVSTVHQFQGDERDVMFFSPVVSIGITPGALAFLRSNGNLFNVAITRARGLLHVVGDRKTSSQCDVDYLERFVAYVDDLETQKWESTVPMPEHLGPNYPPVAHPERVSHWEHVLYRAMASAGLRPIPQFRVEQYDLDFALLVGDRKLAIEVDGEQYHRSWTGELCLRDQLRNQRLIELGWDIRRFWVYEVRDELDDCVQQILRWVPSHAMDAQHAAEASYGSNSACAAHVYSDEWPTPHIPS